MRALAAARCGEDHVLAGPLGPTAMPSAVRGVLVMNDLAEEGFRNKERQGQLDRRHCEVSSTRSSVIDTCLMDRAATGVVKRARQGKHPHRGERSCYGRG